MPFVNIPVIDQLVHPSLGLLTRVAFPGNPYPGPFVSANPPQNALVALTYGVVLRLQAVGPGHGRDVPFPVHYNPPLGRMSVEYQDLSGFAIIRQVTNWLYDDQDFMWDEPLPSLFSLYFSPEDSVNLFCLQT
jgi:hypothetical protein